MARAFSQLALAHGMHTILSNQFATTTINRQPHELELGDLNYALEVIMHCRTDFSVCVPSH